MFSFELTQIVFQPVAYVLIIAVFTLLVGGGKRMLWFYTLSLLALWALSITYAIQFLFAPSLLKAGVSAGCLVVAAIATAVVLTARKRY